MNPDVVPLAAAVDPDLPAGDFSQWLLTMDRAIQGGGESDVPCGDCNACCRSEYFIEIKPADDAARKRIPVELLFDAPGAPPGYQVLGYDQAGSCPLLKEATCSIYSDRPATCRTYDCRVFAATGIAEPGAEKAAVMARAARWRFDYEDDSAHLAQAALARGGCYLVEHFADFGDLLPGNATQLAMLCVRLHPVFVRLGEKMATDDVLEEVRQAVLALRRA